MTAIRRVVVGVAGTPGSLLALRYGADLARAHQAGLVAVLAWLPPGGDYADRRHPSAALREVWRESAKQRLRSAIGLALGGNPPDLQFEARTLRGEPGAILVGVASQAGDVLVVGAGRRSWPGRVLSCRVSRYCLAHAGCPVLAIPPSQLAKTGRRLLGWASRHRGLNVSVLNLPTAR
ncbi:MAG TPA: universal stress protein [Streptosporangiaceae bacterium]|nr:universal stress protein [Streptosporangiaceae bacterium]